MIGDDLVSGNVVGLTKNGAVIPSAEAETEMPVYGLRAGGQRRTGLANAATSAVPSAAVPSAAAAP